MDNITIGFALCGSFCTFDKTIDEMKKMALAGYEIYPILSEHAAVIDTRFGLASDFREEIETICGRKAVTTFTEAEQLSSRRMIDALVIAPCTGSTLGKLAHGISDTVVTFAAKGCLRNDRPVVVAFSTNDALSGSAESIGILLARRGYYFVPFEQDDPENKPRSAAADMSLIPQTLENALEGRQIQPILLCRD